MAKNKKKAWATIVSKEMELVCPPNCPLKYSATVKGESGETITLSCEEGCRYKIYKKRLKGE